MVKNRFVDSHCERLPGAERTQPFGPDTVVWRVNEHMFAAYTEGGVGLSLRTGPPASRIERPSPSRAADDADADGASSVDRPTGDGWSIVAWDTPPEVLRDRIDRSYRMVLRDWPSAAPRTPVPGDTRD